jgi:hypothetical protein
MTVEQIFIAFLDTTRKTRANRRRPTKCFELKDWVAYVEHLGITVVQAQAEKLLKPFEKSGWIDYCDGLDVWTIQKTAPTYTFPEE